MPTVIRTDFLVIDMYVTAIYYFIINEVDYKFG